MNSTQILLSLLCVFGLSVGQILFKLGAPTFIVDLKQANLWRMASNSYVISALVLYAGITFLWIYLLDRLPLKIAYPIQALAFLIVPILSWMFLNEKLIPNTFVGAILIILGVIICIYHQPT